METGNKNNYRILVVEDDDMMQSMIKDTLTNDGYDVVVAPDGFEGWNQFQSADFQLVLSDLKLPRIDGINLLKRIKNTQKGQGILVILMTAYGTIETAVESMKLGAYDYITKPFLSEELLLLVQKAMELQALKDENILLHRELDQRFSLANLIGKSKSMQEIYNLIEIIAPSAATVLIQGESGTGKELVAEAIHHLSPRKKMPFIKVSCASLSETILESELFGHEKGAFTDAVTKKTGRFELAHQGTLFLDDIDDISPTVQVKLLRVLQEKEFERVGGTDTIKVDVRIIAASKLDLREKVHSGTFREDLYYRFNVVPILLPPLRERKEDIPLLVKHFLDKFNKKAKKQITAPVEILQLMIHYDWPGNIRELENLMERLVILAAKNEILPQNIPSYMLEKKKWSLSTLDKAVKETEKEHILRVLESTGWKKKEAAEALDINPKTLWQKMKEYGIE